MKLLTPGLLPGPALAVWGMNASLFLSNWGMNAPLSFNEHLFKKQKYKSQTYCSKRISCFKSSPRTNSRKNREVIKKSKKNVYTGFFSAAK